MKNTVHVSFDGEMNGQIIGKHSMISFGMVLIEPGLNRTFYSEMSPISDDYIPEALAISGFTHEQTKLFEQPKIVMERAKNWLKENIKGKPIFWADNNGFDKSWWHWYAHTFLGSDPFGYSSRRIGDFICGLENDLRFTWKKQRKTIHNHNALSDSIGNAEVLLSYFEKYKIK